MFRVNYSVLLLLLLNACSYGFTALKNPWEKEGVNTVEIPLLKNKTSEIGAEVPFTNSLRLYMESRSPKLKFVTSNGDAYIDGEVAGIVLRPAGIQFGTEATEAAGGLPKERLLAISYTITANIRLSLVRKVDNKVLWTNTFSQARTMKSGSYTDQRSSSNVFIKESEKREALKQLADLMMLFAVDSLLQEF